MLKELVASENLRTEHCCGGCGTPIRDRFYLLAADRAWHGQCLRCCKCSQPLDAELSCFAREGNIYCKEDYFRLFSSRRCARCGAGISSSELVMRARELVFHVDCFSCALCGIHLSAGDTAAIRNGRILCGEHYDVDILSEPNSVSTATQYYTGSSPKGRPRKRKPSTATHHSDESSADMLDRGSTPLRMELLHGEIPQTSLDLTTYDGSQSPGSSGSISGQTRTKRMRTSFKHHQLRTMKSYFAINQNPDAKDLKQLAQKTGLSKRVLQVWFQNARAKWRRNVMRQENGSNNGGGVGNTVTGGNGNILASGNNDNGTNNNINGGNMNHHQQNQIPSSTNLSTGGGGVPQSIQSNVGNNIESNLTPSHSTLEEIHHMTFAELY